MSTGDELADRIFKSRLVRQFLLIKSLVFAWAVISAYFFEPYNSSNSILITSTGNKDSLFAPEAIWLDNQIKRVLAPFASWDGAHFLSIAIDGYKYESQHAFFPLYPWLIRLFAETILAPLRSKLSLMTRCMISGIAISNIFHAATIQTIYYLGILLFDNAHLAYVAASLYCLNPAIVILSSVYSESLFAFLSIMGIMSFYQKRRLLAALSWSLAAATRSNGLLLSGYFIYDFVHSFKFFHPFRTLVRMIRLIILLGISTFGFVMVQYYGFKSFCIDDSTNHPWCLSKLPLIYPYVQHKYWNVGFLRYFTLSQLPNFLLATPMIILSVTGIYSYVMQNRRAFMTSGIQHEPRMDKSPFYIRTLLPNVYLWLFMLVYTVFVAHVQIINRLFTCMPIVYWYMAHIISHRDYSQCAKYSVIYYCGLYGIMYTILFLNYYPPA